MSGAVEVMVAGVITGTARLQAVLKVDMVPVGEEAMAMIAVGLHVAEMRMA